MSLKRLAPCITCHSWNADGSKVALCPNNNEIHIFAKKGNDFVLESKLTEHDQIVTGIDWGKKTNRIVSCSEDRNAYVWTLKDNSWKPTLVILRINRCATDVRWSPEENKFAVASGAKCVSVCYFEEDHDWWVSKHIKKHKSTVIKVDWHPNNVLIATGSTDYKCRIFSAFLKECDKPVQTPFGNKLNFGELFAEFDTTMGWVQSVQWSPSGQKLAFIGHDSILCVAEVTSAQPRVDSVKYNELPYRDLLWTSEDSIVCVGHDCNPTLFQGKGGKWSFVKKLDTGAGGGGGAAPAAANSARDVFKNKVDKAESATETKLTTKHQNCITWIVAYKKAGGAVAQYSTSGLDGSLGLWDAPK